MITRCGNEVMYYSLCNHVLIRSGILSYSVISLLLKFPTVPSFQVQIRTEKKKISSRSTIHHFETFFLCSLEFLILEKEI